MNQVVQSMLIVFFKRILSNLILKLNFVVRVGFILIGIIFSFMKMSNRVHWMNKLLQYKRLTIQLLVMVTLKQHKIYSI